MAKAGTEVAGHGVLVAVEGVVHQLQHGAAHHALGDGVGGDAL